MDKKIMVFGNGWLGSKLAEYFNAEPNEAAIPRSAVDITNREQVLAVLYLHRPQVVINAAGRTSGKPNDPPQNVDWCEDHQDETWKDNIKGACVLASCCLEKGIYFVHLSSGCIFDGQSPGRNGWTEEDTPNPVSYYGKTKMLADNHLKKIMLSNKNLPLLILRLRLPIDGSPHPRNLITKLAGYPRVINVTNSVTVIPDFLYATRALINQEARGIFNVTNSLPVAHANIISWYRDIVDPDHNFELIPPHELVTKAGRSNCILSTEKLERAGIKLSQTRLAVRSCLWQYARALKESSG